ncbi:MAG: metal ABC transporter permease [Oligoflexia bacterium]|nr:metal ABC transporter permease [Oligoflexia bacterium]
MSKPFLACILLTAIHSYLGFHVLEREVIFVDLALAQLAALGATVGYLWGSPLHSSGSYFASLSFAIFGAALFAATRFKKPVVPQESIIGVVYAVAAAAAVLVLSRSPEGGEELKSLLVGHLLFIDWAEIRHLLAMYGLIALLHWKFRRPILQVSLQHEIGVISGKPVWIWDFIFYASFALVVTSSVEVAGVLLVFTFLIVPAICGKLLASTVLGRLGIGWGLGFLTTCVGLGLSYLADLPTGAVIVCTFGALLPLCAVVRAVR